MTRPGPKPGPRCGKPLRETANRKGETCGRPRGHAGGCLSPLAADRNRWSREPKTRQPLRITVPADTYTLMPDDAMAAALTCAQHAHGADDLRGLLEACGLVEYARGPGGYSYGKAAP